MVVVVVVVVLSRLPLFSSFYDLFHIFIDHLREPDMLKIETVYAKSSK